MGDLSQKAGEGRPGIHVPSPPDLFDDRCGRAAGTRSEQAPPGHWPEIARQWQQVGPPVAARAAQDIGFCWDAVREWVRHRGAPRVLLLGVTPELYRLPWPKGTDFLAVDRTQAMIDTVWPGPKEAAQCTDWLALALPDGSRDIVLCDGGLHLLAYPQEQRRLVRLLRRVLSDQGLCILRLYVPPPQRESPEAVLKDLLEGRISSLNILKLRLGMSLLDSAAEGVELGAVWRALHAVAPIWRGWPRGSGGRWSTCWPSTRTGARQPGITSSRLTRSRDLFCGSPGGFEVRRLRVPSYELGEQCPTIVLQRCPSAAVEP